MELLQNGLNEHIYLRKALMTLSKYFKYRGYDKETNKKMLIDWISKQNEEYYGSKYYRYSWVDIIKFIDEVNENTYKNNYRFIDKIDIPVTLGEMKQINMLKNKGDKLVAFTMLFLSKMYNNEEKTFYCSHSKISDLSGVKDFKHIRTIIKNLEKYCIIQVISNNKIKKTINVERGYKVYKEKNVYKYLLEPNDVIIKNILDERFIINDFYDIYNICINKFDFKVTRDFRKNIKKYSGE
jgi:hypothetical protein